MSKLERGIHRWPNPVYRSAFRAVLGAESDAELGFYCPRAIGEEDDVHRRSFLGLGTAVASGVMLSGSVSEFLARAESPTPVPQWVGRSEVAHVTQSAATFSEWEHLYGGGLSREAVGGQLRWAAGLLEARCRTSVVRRELHAAVGNLAEVAGWMSYDAGAHDSADRYFRFGLYCAERAEDQSLRATILSDMARQAVSLRREDAIELAELAQVRDDRLTARERSMLHVVRGRALAREGRIGECLAAIECADEHFAQSVTETPPWMEYYDAAEMRGDSGHALFDLVDHGYDPHPAIDRLDFAVHHHTPKYARSKTLSLIKSITLQINDDPGAAAHRGLEALTRAQDLRSQRVRNYLRDLYVATKPHARYGDVTDLRHQIAKTLQR
ncbi:XRE family transcriptional regulator [Saccharopolyspora shandongensis]|uniref:XRE family transcriptional regulator n=1 Tax=Saccharopolyspora shandongensis TaxID=418495 RepID=UPI00115F9453|nr:XRE family transcriptional regulator [Saccharopolyspora shandongensis]